MPRLQRATIKQRRRALKEPAPLAPNGQVRRNRAASTELAQAVESDLNPDTAITTEELDALVRLLGPELDRFLSDKT